MKKLSDFYQSGAQREKFISLCLVYHAFKKVDLTNKESIESCQKIIATQKENFGFGTDFGKKTSSISVKFFGKAAKSNTLELVDKVSSLLNGKLADEKLKIPTK